MHKQIKEMQNSSKQRNTGITLDSKGQILTRVEKRLERWKKYTQDNTIRTQPEINNPYPVQK